MNISSCITCYLIVRQHIILPTNNLLWVYVFGEGWDSIAQKRSTEAPIFSRRDQFFGLVKDVYKALLMEETLMNVIYDYDFMSFDTFFSQECSLFACLGEGG